MHSTMPRDGTPHSATHPPMSWGAFSTLGLREIRLGWMQKEISSLFPFLMKNNFTALLHRIDSVVCWRESHSIHGAINRNPHRFYVATRKNDGGGSERRERGDSFPLFALNVPTSLHQRPFDVTGKSSSFHFPLYRPGLH